MMREGPTFFLAAAVILRVGARNDARSPQRRGVICNDGGLNTTYPNNKNQLPTPPEAGFFLLSAV
jgi:hypothetical protein